MNRVKIGKNSFVRYKLYLWKEYVNRYSSWKEFSEMESFTVVRVLSRNQLNDSVERGKLYQSWMDTKLNEWNSNLVMKKLIPWQQLQLLYNCLMHLQWWIILQFKHKSQWRIFNVWFILPGIHFSSYVNSIWNAMWYFMWITVWKLNSFSRITIQFLLITIPNLSHECFTYCTLQIIDTEQWQDIMSS